mgnify:CR=1 FL=1
MGGLQPKTLPPKKSLWSPRIAQSRCTGREASLREGTLAAEGVLRQNLHRFLDTHAPSLQLQWFTIDSDARIIEAFA